MFDLNYRVKLKHISDIEERNKALVSARIEHPKLNDKKLLNSTFREALEYDDPGAISLLDTLEQKTIREQMVRLKAGINRNKWSGKKRAIKLNKLLALATQYKPKN